MEGVCSVCLGLKTVNMNKRLGVLVCHTCYSKSRNIPKLGVECSRCGKINVVGKLTHDYKPICRSCYQRERYHSKTAHKSCFWCKEIGRVQALTASRDPICPRCYKKDKLRYKVCSLCGQSGFVETRNKDGEPICKNCYSKARYHNSSKYEECSECHRARPVHARTPVGNLPLCLTCYQKTHIRVCLGCSTIKYMYTGRYCRQCYLKKLRDKRSFIKSSLRI